jgi:2-desacetyl-2-hydroxyethyl bacteriochlorophyllide A dehydrogenase
MKTLAYTSPLQLTFGEAAEPVPQKGSAIIRIKSVGICGTDLHAYEGTQPYFTYPRIPGHELAGDLVDTGGAAGFQPLEKVTFLPYFNCGHCVACRRNRPNCCANLRVFGVHMDGGLSELVSVPSSFLVHGEGLSYDDLSLVEPLAIGAHGVARAAIEPGEFVLVMGAGPIGLGTMELAILKGAKVIALDTNNNRLSFCAHHLNVHATIDPTTEDVTGQLRALTNGEMPTVVIDATGNINAINKGLDYLAHSGTYVLIGLQKENFSFSHPEFHKRETTLMSSRNATRADFEYVIKNIRNGLLKPQKYITRRIPFENMLTEFPRLFDADTTVIKAMVMML